MSDKYNVGAAFPVHFKDGDGTDLVDVGMSLRDYFAGNSPFGIEQALNVINGFESSENNSVRINDLSKALANMNYRYADAMIEARRGQ